MKKLYFLPFDGNLHFTKIENFSYLPSDTALGICCYVDTTNSYSTFPTLAPAIAHTIICATLIPHYYLCPQNDFFHIHMQIHGCKRARTHTHTDIKSNKPSCKYGYSSHTCTMTPQTRRGHTQLC